MPKKKIIIFVLTLSFFSSIFYMPVFTPKTEAVLGVGDTVIVLSDILRDTVKWVTDTAAQVLAQELIDRMVQSSINWANSGFEGNPAYVTDPKQYFTDIADGVAGEFIDKELGLGFLCSPFQAQIRISLRNYYKPLPRYQCTLSEVGDNISNFYGDFSQGGWDTWLTVTQTSGGNPYDSFIAAQIELDSRIAERLDIDKTKLLWGEGFRDWAPCVKWENDDPQTGKCLERDQTRTPGNIIKSQLDRALPTGLEKLITVEHIDQLISAFATGLLKRFVFTSDPDEGLFNPKNKPESSWPDPNVDPASTIPPITCPSGFVLDASGYFCTYVGTGTSGGIPGPDANGCYGIGCEPCTTTADCGVGETINGDPAINGVYAGSCRINISASFHTSVHMTEKQCALVNQTISDGITFDPITGAASGGTYSNAINAVALVCGGNGGGENRGSDYLYTDPLHYICGFP